LNAANTRHTHLISRKGLTLIEVVVTIAILALLAGISYSSYNNARLQTRRNDAKEAVLNTQAMVERYLVLNNLAASGLTTAVITAQFATYLSASGTPVYSKNSLYKITLATSGSGYIISATAVDNGAACNPANLQQQCQDLTCRQIAIDNNSKVSYNSTGVLANATTTTCW
jgi:type IV pilus assembly protein PilE